LENVDLLHKEEERTSALHVINLGLSFECGLSGDDDDDDDDILPNFTRVQKYSFVLRVEMCILPDRQNSSTVIAATKNN
jgi:hypothetical protein